MTHHPLAVAYSPDYLHWMLGAGDGSHPTNPARAGLATEFLLEQLGDAELGGQVLVLDPADEQLVSQSRVRAALEAVHDPAYVAEVLDAGESGEWSGYQPILGETAATMFAGTMVLVERMIAGEATVAFNPQGAKHHAAFNHSSGFCVFNDMAFAALEFEAAGLRPLYLDWDIHAGDGVQDMLADTSIPTLSIHNGSLFPGNDTTRDHAQRNQRHTWHNEASAYYNWNVTAHDGDEAFAWAIDEAMSVIADYQPGVILLAAGADGHEGSDNLGGTNLYTYQGYNYAAQRVAEAAHASAQGRVLIGGAGGYQPLTHTPRIWANVVAAIYQHQTQKGH
jgi:acetoin utilization protein AcuC